MKKGTDCMPTELQPMTEFQLGWVVGILEGEGYFGYHGRCPVITVVNTDMDTLDELQVVTGVGSLTKLKVEPHRKPSRRWVVARRMDVLALCLLTQQHMSNRRKTQIDRVLEYYSGGRFEDFRRSFDSQKYIKRFR